MGFARVLGFYGGHGLNFPLPRARLSNCLMKSFFSSLAFRRRDFGPHSIQKRATLEQRDPSSCAIKGNVSSSGRIYYVPGARAYASVRMDDIAAGKRWFCSVTEAQQAGWRKAR